MNLHTLENRVHSIRLQIHEPGGFVHRVGASGPLVDWHLHTHNSLPSILKRPEINLGSSYVRGEWDVDTRLLADLVQALVSKCARPRWLPARWLQYLRARLPHSHKPDPLPHWQDTSVWVSRLCLGDTLFHGCSLYSEPGMSLEQAQRTRYRSLIARLQIQPGQQLLDLNAGWGALALYLAEQTGVQVTAMVKTREQLRYAHSEARRRGLEAKTHFRLGSFHQCRGRFDRILATGFFERFTEFTYPVLFQHFDELLQDDGFVWIQVTGRSKDTALSNRWYQTQLPSPHSLPLFSDLTSALQTTDLRPLLLEDQTGHRLQDLDNQAQRFYRHRSAISQRFGERRTRHWEFRLASLTTAMRWGQLSQYELLLGSARSVCPAFDQALQTPADSLPADITDRIQGLARPT
ncbi:MAG: cyclopropane-fatty-acyl-phospholipid synthase family protein [Gammaproteobacteria bacterium]|nr:MAG: cyclopropane-fatty-acyl-phospholipid synthase family protein [Gammaproteobacteria bacterium]